MWPWRSRDSVEKFASWVGEDSGEGLQVSQGDAVTDGAVLIIVGSLDKNVLRVRHFEHGGFAAFVAQRGEALAFRGELRGTPQAGKFVEGSFRFGVERTDSSDEL
jgi:hypothetical protein